MPVNGNFLFFVVQTDSLTWALTRKKTDSEKPGEEKLKRVLNLFDLIFLSTGSTLGAGVYVLAGAVSKTIAGPAVVVSFAIAAVVSAFSGKTTKILNEFLKKKNINFTRGTSTLPLKVK